MTIGNRDYVRELIGGMESDNVTDADIDKALEYGLSEVYGYTFKDNWATDTTHPLFDKAEATVHYFASSLILDKFSGDGEKANRHRARAMENAKELKIQYDEYVLVNGTDGSGGGSGGSSNSKFSVAIAAYKTFPLNPSAEVYRSPSIIPGD